MKKFLIAFFLTIILVLSGCSGSNSGKTGTDDQVTSGYGLEVDFKIDDRYIKQRKLIYELNFRNSGLKPVKLSPSNVDLYTIQSEGQNSYFSSESLNSFEEKVFGNQGELELYNDQERDAAGTLLFADNFDFKDYTKLDYLLEVKYDYETLFNNNLEFIEEFGMFKLNKLDKVSQAAPLQISDIKLVPGIENNEYILEYYFEDRGKSSSLAEDETTVEIRELTILFGSEDITSNCIGLQKEESKRDKELSINELKVSRNSDLVVECRITIENEDTFTTKTSGNFEYEYKIKKIGSISIPKITN
ncbi:MAG: hypothetical protein PF569_06580 [Candidatus Woesearchaeota archaeon]|jgi:hypothetical protein|nr:hypothetical protein [Candidatus Woesearchaeota archaeon]